MSDYTPERIRAIAERFDIGAAGFRDALEAKLQELVSVALVRPEAAGMAAPGQPTVGDRDAAVDLVRAIIARANDATDAEVGSGEERDERIIGKAAGSRPVARIRDNRATTEFLGPTNPSYAALIAASGPALNRIIPAVGRIELTHSELPWVGTAWLVAPNVLVTNRHVAREFARRRESGDGFVFSAGLDGLTPIAVDVDFLEEEDRQDANEHPVTSVLWIAPAGEPDVALLQVARAPGGPPLPKPIPLASAIDTSANIAAIGYPARDPSVPDFELVRSIFGEVFDKKRLAPGKILSADELRLTHDCSTLGGNSGSVLVDMSTGLAVALHKGGYLDDSANTAVPSTYIIRCLEALRAMPAPVSAQTEGAAPASPPVVNAPIAIEAGAGTVATLRFTIPIEVTVRLGAPLPLGGGGHPLAVSTGVAAATTVEDAVAEASRLLRGHPNVLRIRPGYRFKNGWITAERVIVIEVRSKLDPASLASHGEAPLPKDVRGVGVDVRTAPLGEQLASLGVDLSAPERKARAAKYREPPGYDQPGSTVALDRVRERMDAVFHVSPDSGFTILRGFLQRVRRTLTATIYEWEAGNHVSKELEAAIAPNRKLKMVTQKRGAFNSDATESAVADMKDRLGARFEHVFASVRGPNRLIHSSYHIKIASRDDEELWLSSGNWKSSNLPDIDPAGDDERDDRPLRESNREWHVTLKSATLAKLFRRYVEHDFDQAERFPGTDEDEESVGVGQLLFDVPESAFALDDVDEARRVEYFDPLEIHGEEIDVQPLLTPDRDPDGERMFIRAATALVRSATRRVFVQNQTFNLSGDDNEEVVAFYTALRDQHGRGLDVRIIIRDSREFPGEAAQKQQETIERFKQFGLDTSPDGMRLQRRCHTKGIVVDSSSVILGSQNFSNAGALFNRDASLLVRAPKKVAEYFERVFLYDWRFRAHNDADERVGGVRRSDGRSPPARGFRRVTLAELLGEGS